MFQVSYAVMQTLRLGMLFVELGYRADHIAGLGSLFCSRRHGYTPALVNKSFRGSAGSTASSSFINLRTRSSVGLGTITWISTYLSPPEPLRAVGMPFSRSLSVLPLLVPGVILTHHRPSIVGPS